MVTYVPFAHSTEAFEWLPVREAQMGIPQESVASQPQIAGMQLDCKQSSLSFVVPAMKTGYWENSQQSDEAD